MPAKSTRPRRWNGAELREARGEKAKRGKGEMEPKRPSTHPYIPNSAPAAREAMLRAIGVADAADLYKVIPEPLKLKRALDLPRPLRSELELRRHVEGLLAQNASCADHLSFLGGGC